MAAWLADQNLVPEVILVSTSLRTRETVELMIDQWIQKPITIFTEQLYQASPEEIIRVIGSDGRDAGRLMVVAHNPGMTGLVSQFAGEFHEMATAAVAAFQSDLESWNQLQIATAMQLTAIMRPKQLDRGD